MRILILEDEQQAGEKLMKFIDDVLPGAEVDWCRSVSEGLEYFSTDQRVELIFSDIELLDGNVFELYRKHTINCPIIFCTAYDSFYMEAFQTNGIAYLLKPYSKEDFIKAWDKYASLFRATNLSEPQLSTKMMEEMMELLARKSKTYKTSFSVKKREGVFILDIDKVAYFQAQGDFVYAVDENDQKHVLNYTLAAIETSIDPGIFIKINRGELISRNHIVKYNPYSKNRLAITLTRPAVLLYTSNSRAAAFKKWLEQ